EVRALHAVVRALHDEEAVAAQREIHRVAGLLDRALLEHRVGAGEAHAGAEAIAAELAAEHVGEVGAVALVADGVDVGDVVTDDADGRAVRGHAAGADVEAVEDAHGVAPGAPIARTSAGVTRVLPMRRCVPVAPSSRPDTTPVSSGVAVTVEPAAPCASTS